MTKPRRWRGLRISGNADAAASVNDLQQHYVMGKIMIKPRRWRGLRISGNEMQQHPLMTCSSFM